MIRQIERIANRAGLLRSKIYKEIAGALSGKHGLEVGGPSEVFTQRSLIPIYPLIGKLDTSNFSDRNIWSTQQVDYVHDATKLSSIKDGTYDFLLASHVLEHVANPLKAMVEWRRVLKPSGFLLILLPFKEYTFDHRRPYTTLAHMKEDYDRDQTEDDLTHLEEILALHSLDRDRPAGTPAEFRKRGLRNSENRALHHHVFDPQLLPRIFSETGFELLKQSIDYPFHIVAFGRKPV